jgi:hypothetical protein
MSTPHTWVRDLDGAEQFIARYRIDHPKLPTEPVPLAISIPEFTTVESARGAVIRLSRQLDGLDLHGYPALQVARWMFLYGGKVLQNRYVEQASVDHAYSMAMAAVELDGLNDDVEYEEN